MKFISRFTVRTLFARKKSIAYLLILALIIPMIIPGYGGTAYVKAAESLGDEVSLTSIDTVTGGAIRITSKAGEEGELDDIFTFKSLMYGPSSDFNEEYENNESFKNVNDLDIITPDDGFVLAVKYEWDTNNYTVTSGNTAKIKLPDQLSSNDLTSLLIRTQDVNGVTIEVGTYSVSEGWLIFTFNDKLSQIESAVQNGFVALALKFNMESFEENVVQKIEFNDKEDKTITLALKPQSATTSIKKTAPLPEGGYADAKEISWAIEILNAEGNSLENAQVLDHIPTGLALKEGSVKIYDLTMGYDGESNKGAVSDASKYTISTDGNLVVDFPQVDVYKGYRIEYVTEITNFAQATFTNDAELSYAGLEDPMPASATVSEITRSGSIEKDGTKVNDFQVEWWIDVNKGGIAINDAIVADNLPDGHTITPNSIEIYELNKSGANWNQGTKVTPNPKPTGFPIELGDIGNTKAYRIRYKTDINYTEVNEGIYQVDNLFTNTAILKSGDSTISQATKQVPITRATIITKTGNHNGFSYDVASKKLSWKIDINKAKHNLTGVSVEDLIPTGLGIEASNIVVKNVTTNSVVNPTINITPVTGGKKIEITLGDIGPNQYEITYTTTVTNFNIDSITNQAIIKGTGVGVGPGTTDGNPIIKSVSIPNNEYSKNFLNMDYNEKTISWNLVMDPKREPITSMKITDTFPNGGMILLHDTENPLVVYHGGTKLVEGTHYTLNPHTADALNEYNTGFILEFINGFTIENQIEITYKTSFDPEKGAGVKTDTTPEAYEYKNSANFFGLTEEGHTINKDRFAGAGLEQDSSFNSGKKDGKLVSMKSTKSGLEQVNGWVSGNERQIEWEVYVNYLKQNLGTNVSVEDSWDYDGEFIESSIQIKKYIVNADGSTNITSDILDSSNYDVVPDSDGKGFTLNFKPLYALNERYVIIYKTTVPNISKENYTNTATVIVGEESHPYSNTINFSEYNNYLTKGADGNPSQTFTDDELTWKININESLSVIENAKVEDTISAGLVYINDSLNVYEYLNGAKVLLEQGDDKDYTLVVDTSGDKTILTIEFTNTIDSHYLIEYRTAVTAKTGSVNNKVAFTGESITVTPITSKNLKATQVSFVGGNTASNRGEIRIDKINSESKAFINLAAKFKIYYKLNGVVTPLGPGEYSTVNGKILLNNLPYRTYYIEEIESPKGYEEVPATPITYEITLNSSNRLDAQSNANHKVENTKVKTDISVTKVWEGGPSTKPEVWVQLKRDGINFGTPVKLNETLKYKWSNLDKANDTNGNDYAYTVEEAVIDNYEPIITGNATEGYVISNKYVPSKISITASKVWVNGPKPNITIQLKQNGEVVEEVEFTATKTTHTWNNLNKTDNTGNEYVYTVDEKEVPDSYEKVITGNVTEGFKITNTYKIPKIDIKVKKIWAGGQKPDVTINLLRDGTKVDEISLTKDNPEYEWTELEKTDIDGNVYTYSVDEENVPENYTAQTTGTEQTGFTITNTYASPKTVITGTKVWVNGPEVKPTIQLQLNQNGINCGSPITLEHPNTSHIWKDLDETDSNGVKYIYTIDEVETPDHYGKEISDDGLTITNTFGSRKTDVIGHKNWEYGPEQRPTIELQLYRNGVKFNNAVSLESGSTNHIWKGLDIVDGQGKPYIYTVDEVKVPENYIKTSDGASLTVTNSYVIPKTDITGTKVWSGIQGIKPVIKIQLYRDGEAYGEPVTLNDGDTSYTWLDLDKTDINGHEHKYTIDEVDVPTNYWKTISKDGLTITNTYVNPTNPVDPTPQPTPGPDPTPTPDPDPTPTPGPTPTSTPGPKPTSTPGPVPTSKPSPTPTSTPTSTSTPTIPTTEDPTEPPTYELTEVPDPNDPDSPDVFILIDENGVPLGTYTKVKQPDGSYLYIGDNNIPLGTIIQKLPKTGEEEQWGYYLFGIAMALMGYIALLLKRKKETE